jgi:hypothetical protein
VICYMGWRMFVQAPEKRGGKHSAMLNVNSSGRNLQGEDFIFETRETDSIPD